MASGLACSDSQLSSCTICLPLTACRRTCRLFSSGRSFGVFVLLMRPPSFLKWLDGTFSPLLSFACCIAVAAAVASAVASVVVQRRRLPAWTALMMWLKPHFQDCRRSWIDMWLLDIDMTLLSRWHGSVPRIALWASPYFRRIPRASEDEAER